MYPPGIIERISTHLSRGFEVHDDVLQFAESVLGLDSEELYEELKTCAQEEDLHGLLDLVLFPTPEIRRGIEPEIPAEGLKPSSLEDLGESLSDTETTLLLEGYPAVSLVLDSGRAGQYLKRLHLDRPVPPLSLRPETELLVECRIAIRRARFHPLPGRMEFLGSLLEKGDGEQLPAILPSVLKVFEEHPPGIPVAEELRQALERYRGAREGARRWEEIRKTYSPEFMMMQKINHPGMDAVDAEDRIRGIILAGRAVYGPAFGVKMDLPILEEEAKSGNDVIRFFRELDS
jgi:hypothetical protein